MKRRAPTRRPLVLLFAAALMVAGGVAAAPTSAVEIDAKRRQTPNGITVLLVERHGLPIISIQMLIRAGSMNDPEPLGGVANLVANLLDEGTTTRSSAQIAEEVDFMGARLDASAGADASTASLTVLKKDLAKGLAILADIVRRPSFPAAEIERKRQQTLGAIIAQQDDPAAVAEKAFQNVIFQNHPYHRPVEGTEATVPKIQRADITKFYDTYYRPNNAILAVVGDVTEAELMALVDAEFGGWEARDVPPVTAPSPNLPERRRMEVIDRSLTQASLVMGHVGIQRNNPDYYAVVVMNYILGGGGFSSRLLKKIRDEQGLVYGIASHFDARVHPGSFEVSLQTKTATADEALAGVLAELERIRREKVTAQELTEAKEFLVGSFPLRMETNARMAALLSQIEFYGLGRSYFDDYPDKIRAVTADDVLRAAQRYLHPDKLTLVAVGRKAELQLSVE